MLPRKRLSGAEYRKTAELRAKKAKQSAKAMSSWLKKSTEDADPDGLKHENQSDSDYQGEDEASVGFVEPLTETTLAEPIDAVLFDPSKPSCSNLEDRPVENYLHINSSTAEESVSSVTLTIDPSEPRTWPTHDKINDNVRCFLSAETTKLVTSFPKCIEFQSTEREGRHLTNSAWYKELLNNEKVKRTWLMYSKKDNALFCIPCKLFKSPETLKPGMYSLQTSGLTNWKKALEKLCQHEISKLHKENFVKWKTLIKSMNNENFGISSQLGNAIESEKLKWREILRVIIDAILYLACNSLPLRGTIETQSKLTMSFTSKEQGNFLNLIVLLSKHNATLKAALEERKKGQVSYLSKTVQNEVIEMMGDCVRNKILNDVLQAKYYTIMFDCTPDVSHTEQMSQVIRYVTKNNQDEYEVKESFIDFLEVCGKTGEYLTDTIISKLKKDGLEIKNCRGQSYDNGSNMSGVYKGVQARFQETNPRAVYVPCIAHSLNLVGLNASSVSAETSNVFGVVQRLYTFFVFSPQRWEIMKTNTKTNLKGTSQTRWSAKSEAVHALVKNIDGVIEALKVLKEGQNPPETKSEAESLLHAVLDFRFLLYLVAWAELLKEVNRVNKEIQKNDVILSKSLDMLKGLTKTMERLRKEPNLWLQTAKEIAERIGVEPTLTSHRNPKKKRLPGEIMEDQVRSFSPEERFFHSIKEVIDVITTELKTRMGSAKNLNESFSFLTGRGLWELTDKDLKTRSRNLAIAYPEDLSQDEFPIEVLVFRDHVTETDSKEFNALDLLNFIQKRDLCDAFPNVCVALRIYSTLPTTSAGCERSFSKLKLIKNYLRSSMCQERLSNLSILSIESDIANSINYEDAINSFAERKARKVPL